MYSKIYDFCKAKNKGNCFVNGTEPTPRVNFITSLCDEMGLDYVIDKFQRDRDSMSNGKTDYRINDFPMIELDIPEDKLEQATAVYDEFEQKMDDLYMAKAVMGEYRKVEIEYTEKLKRIVGKLETKENFYFNIILEGTSDKFVVAHHDIVNPASDNANDNSCSVINALMIKKLRPDVNVVILDGEEYGGIGSEHLSKRINKGDFPCKWILNLELTGRGGKNFFVGGMGTPLTNWIAEKFECPIVNVPFNDSVIFRKHGINSTVINPLPITNKKTPIVNKDGEFLAFEMLFNCHKMEDSVETIDPSDMEEFVNDICLKIIDEA